MLHISMNANWRMNQLLILIFLIDNNASSSQAGMKQHVDANYDWTVIVMTTQFETVFFFIFSEKRPRIEGSSAESETGDEIISLLVHI